MTIDGSAAHRDHAGVADPLTPELRCVARAAAAAAGGPRFAGIAAVAPAALVDLAHRHRLGAPVLDLLAAQCRAGDPGVADRLTANARAKRIKALNLARHAAAISAALAAADIRHLALKGPALARQVYGDPVARDSKDLDFLIDPAAFEWAVAVVRGLGFDDGDCFDFPGRKDQVLAGHGVEVEMHTRLVDVASLLPIDFADLWAARAAVTLGSTAMPVPGAVHTMLYLCVHGAEHSWFRLRWLQDIARIVIASPAVVADCLALADRLRLTAVVVSALHLVERVFDIAVPGAPPLDRMSSGLVRLAEAALVLPARVGSRPPLRWLARKLPAQLGMRGDWGYRRDFVRHVLLSPRAFDLAPWPRWARWAYQPLRPLLFLRSRWHGRRD